MQEKSKLELPPHDSMPLHTSEVACPPSLHPAKSESKWTVMANLKKFPQAVPDKLRLQEWQGWTDGQTDRQPKNIMPLAMVVICMKPQH